MAKKSVIWKEGQSILDIAFIAYGEYDVFKLLEENPSLQTIGNDEYIGKEVFYTPPVNDNLRKLGLIGTKPNTGEIEATPAPAPNLSYLITHVPQYIVTHSGQKFLIE